MMKLTPRYKRTLGRPAQAMVEFAIVAPILFLLLIGIIEVGRMIFYYAAASNASREAVRYGSAIGYDDLGELKYRHCAAIRDIVRRSSLITIPDADILITYDDGPGTTALSPSPCAPGVAVAPGYFVSSGDRIQVSVTARYKPYTKIVPWGPRNFTSTSYRTILGFVQIVSTPSGGSGGGGGGGGGSTDTPTPTDPANPPTDTPTATATGTPPTETPTETPTQTPEGNYTPLPTGTPTDSTPTETPTDTPTATPTYTPTFTPTVVLGCGEIHGGAITINSNYMAMTFSNPHVPLTVSSVTVRWNTSSGAPSQRSLDLKSASLGSLFWTGTDNSGNLTITPADVIIPGNNAESTIFFTFDDFYDHENGSESITITLSTPGCENVTIQSTPPTATPTETPTPTATP